MTYWNGISRFSIISLLVIDNIYQNIFLMSNCVKEPTEGFRKIEILGADSPQGVRLYITTFRTPACASARRQIYSQLCSKTDIY